MLEFKFKIVGSKDGLITILKHCRTYQKGACPPQLLLRRSFSSN